MQTKEEQVARFNQLWPVGSAVRRSAAGSVLVGVTMTPAFLNKKGEAVIDVDLNGGMGILQSSPLSFLEGLVPPKATPERVRLSEQHVVATFNLKHAVGDQFVYNERGPKSIVTTRTPAFVREGQAMIAVDQLKGYIYPRYLTPVPTELTVPKKMVDGSEVIKLIALHILCRCEENDAYNTGNVCLQCKLVAGVNKLAEGEKV